MRSPTLSYWPKLRVRHHASRPPCVTLFFPAAHGFDLVSSWLSLAPVAMTDLRCRRQPQQPSSCCIAPP
jgi:hypothetical protein